MSTDLSVIKGGSEFLNLFCVTVGLKMFIFKVGVISMRVFQ